MVLEIVIVCLLARLRHCRLLPLYKAPAFYPMLIVQILLALAQFSLFFHTEVFVPLGRYLEQAVILSALYAIVRYRLYIPAVAGSASVLLGSALNRFVIAQNGGKMPVFPSLSYCTGYLERGELFTFDVAHVLGGADTRYPFLADVIDYGYCILSIGDVFIHLFFCIIFYQLIAAVNRPQEER